MNWEFFTSKYFFITFPVKNNFLFFAPVWRSDQVAVGQQDESGEHLQRGQAAGPQAAASRV